MRFRAPVDDSDDDDGPLHGGGSGDGDGEAEATVVPLGGGPTYNEATARRILEEAVLVPADYAARGAGDGEAVAGFDPSDAALDGTYVVDNDAYSGNYFSRWPITPLTYFAHIGDAKMCRYLLSRGASATKGSDSDWDYFPMMAAARGGHLDICRLLYANGAQNDVRRTNGHGWTSFARAVMEKRDETVRWLVLRGALCVDDISEEVDEDCVIGAFQNLRNRGKSKTIVSVCNRLVEWAEEVTGAHSSLVAFLLGALPPAPNTDRGRCLLQVLGGVPGVRKDIGDFVGLEVTKGKRLRILRQVVDVLPALLRWYDHGLPEGGGGYGDVEYRRG